MRADLDIIDLLVIDLRLPHAAGVELIRSVRKLDQGRLPILVFSGTISSAEEVRELAALGVAGYVNEYSAVQHILPSLAPAPLPRQLQPPVAAPGWCSASRSPTGSGDTITAVLTLNLSKGGIGIRTMNPLTESTRVRLRFRLPGARREVEAEARVAWSDRRIGMGLQFEKVQAEDQAAIDEFVDTHFFNTRV